MNKSGRLIISAILGVVCILIALFNGLFVYSFLMNLIIAVVVFVLFTGGLYFLLGLVQNLFLFLFTPGKMIVAIPLAIVIWIMLSSSDPTWTAEMGFFKKVEVAFTFWLSGLFFLGLISAILRILLPASVGISRGVSHQTDKMANHMSSAIEKSMRGDKAADEAYRRQQENLNMQKIHEWDAMDAAKKGDARGAYVSGKKAEYYQNKKD